jgi:hypothetical protein
MSECGIFKKNNPKQVLYEKKLYLCTRKNRKKLYYIFINIKKLKFYEKKS